jgi:hypothetical protein
MFDLHGKRRLRVSRLRMYYCLWCLTGNLHPCLNVLRQTPIPLPAACFQKPFHFLFLNPTLAALIVTVTVFSTFSIAALIGKEG